DPATGVISGTLGTTAHAASPYLVQVAVSDGTASATQTFAWRVVHVAVVNPGDQTSGEGATVSLALQASDPDGDPLAYSAAGLPPGLSINSSTGLIAGTIASGAAVDGPFAVSVAATDGAYGASLDFSWAVTRANN